MMGMTIFATGGASRRAPEQGNRWLGAVLATVLFTGWLILLPLAASAQDLPALTGRVVDNAGLIDDATESTLTAKLAAFEQKSSDQIVVATIPNLQGESIEQYANRLFRFWKLGQASENNGILLLVAKDDRKMRIETGYGLEGTLTDLHAKLIIENTMVPAFRAGNFAGGISGAVDDIILVLEGNGDELQDRFNRNQDNLFNFLPESDVDPIFVIFIVIWGTLFFGGFALTFLLPIFGTKVGKNRYRWLGMDITVGGGSSSGSSSGSGWSSGSSSSSGGGGFSGGGGSSGGGGASGSW